MILNSVRLKKIKKHVYSRLKDNLDSLKDPSIHGSFQATVAGIFAALFTLYGEILMGGGGGGEGGRTTQPWVTDQILDLCDQRRDVKKAKNTTNGVEDTEKSARRSGKA